MATTSRINQRGLPSQKSTNNKQQPLPSISSNDPATTTTITTSYQQALDLLLPTQQILAGFTHRNKNQHRAAKWWASLGMLRRQIGKLIEEVEDLVVAIDEDEKKNNKKKKKQPTPRQGKDAKSNTNAKGKNAGQEEDKDVVLLHHPVSRLGVREPRDSGLGENRGPAETMVVSENHLSASDAAAAVVEERARWLRDVLGPKCYLSFSQLAADNQYAQLGLVLLGALATVRTACGILAAPTSSDETGDHSQERFGTAAAPGVTAALDEASAVDKTPADLDDVDMDIGVAISRDEFLNRDTAKQKKKKTMKKTISIATDPDAKDLKLPAHPSSLRSGADGTMREQVDQAAVSATNMVTTVDHDDVDDEPAKKKLKKKKKKTKKGDEFDDLFAGL